MADEAKALRREILKQDRGPGRKYPPGLRARVGSWGARERSAGRAWDALASELGIGTATLRRWAEAPAEGRRSPSRLVPVHVVPAERERTYVVVSPGGFRVEALALAEAAALLRALG